MIRAALLAALLAAPAALGFAQPAQHAAKTGAATPFPWPSFDDAVAAARVSGKPILIEIYAPWCGWCRKMQDQVYSDADLQAYLGEHFEYGRLNIDDTETRHDFEGYDVTSQELGYGLGAEGTPTTVFLQWKDGHVQYITRLPGYSDLHTFRRVLRYIATDAFHEQTFEEYLKNAPEDD